MVVSRGFIFFVVNLVVVFLYVNADVSHIVGKEGSSPPAVNNGPPPTPVTDICLGCICEAVSSCNQSLKCDGSTCGLFRITWAYWADSGKPTQQGEANDSPTAYENCVNEPFCAARAVQGYMARFPQDCNNDGIVDCRDYAAIHKLGGYGCSTDNLPAFYVNRFDQCLKQASSYQG